MLFAALTLTTVYYAVYQNAERRLQQKTEALSQQLVGQLTAELEKHRYLPELLGQNPEARALLASAIPDPERLADFNRTLEIASRIAGTADIYLMRADGMTIAASNWNTHASFIGKNFAFRQYFQQAMEGQLGRYYALGTTSKKRGYYFANAIPDAQGKPVGVMVVKVDIDTQEAQWQQDSAEFMVTDPDGVVFMSSQSAWRLQALQPLSALTQAKLFQNQRYNQQAIHPLTWRSRIDPALDLQRVDTGQYDYLVHKRAMPFIEWDVYILTDWRSITRSVVVTVAIIAFMLLLTLLLVYVLWKNQRQRREYEQKAREDLEAKVAERTRELQRTQEELVQAAKMAALGQLSAGINHELNNPLTAIRAYADNATQFLAIGKPEMAHHNLREIVSLTERMATITRQLKTFSRKSAGQIETCDLHWALDSALSIVQPKLAQTRVVLEQQRDAATRYVQADLVWLEQILVNLVSNAAEAVEEQAEPRVWVTLQVQGAQVDISVRDNGTGISEAAMSHVFEAFFTTKTVGKGLGLGLSISYRLARDMNGQLQVANAPQGGAIFTLTLQQATHGETA